MTPPGPGLEVQLKVTAYGVNGFVLDAHFEVPAGITVLFGPSGSGKSTTLAAIAGLIHADAGRIALGGQVWFDSKAGVDLPPHRRGVSYVFQSGALFPHLTAIQNVAYGIARSLPRATRLARAREMLERMKVGHLADRKPRTFSGGETQRVALARGFARSPRLVLLDEAFSAMDRQLRQALCADARAAIVDLGIPAIVVTHRMMEARAMGDRAVAIAGGRTGAAGRIDEVIPEAGPAPAGGRAQLFEEIDKTPVPDVRSK
jgi:molybdate transport system ATP-binding protein